MDVLSDVLGAVRLCGAAFFTAECSAPWALESPNPDLLATIVMPEAEHVSFFHILIEGECLIEDETRESFGMRSGDVVVFPDAMRTRCEAAGMQRRLISSTYGPAPHLMQYRMSLWVVAAGGPGSSADI